MARAIVFTIREYNELIPFENSQQLSATIVNNVYNGQLSSSKEFFLRKIMESKLDDLDFAEYDSACYYKHNTKGFMEDNTEFDYYYDKHRFKSFSFEVNGRKILLLETNKTIGNHFSCEYNKLKGKEELRKVDIDFKKIEREMDLVGCSIRTKDDPNVRTYQLTGSNLFIARAYTDLTEAGDISSLTYEISNDGNVYRILVSIRSLIFIRSDNDMDPKSIIPLIYEVLDRFILK